MREQKTLANGSLVRLGGVVYLLATVGCATMQLPVEAPQWIGTSEPFRQIVEELSHPSMEGRGAGTAGIDRARDYLVERFKAFGLHPAFGRGPNFQFTQPFEMNLAVEVRHEALRLTVGTPEAGSLELQPDKDFSVLGLSANGSFEGPAVFVGYGIDRGDGVYNSFAILEPDQLAGKVAVAFCFEPMDDQHRSQWAGGDHEEAGSWSTAAFLARKAEEAARRGAIALLVVNPPSHDAILMLRTLNQSVGSRAPIPVLQIHSRIFEQMLSNQRKKSRQLARRLQRRADMGETVVLELNLIGGRVELDRPRAKVANVAAVLPGIGPLAQEVVVVGAHYDHLGYGQVGDRKRKRISYLGGHRRETDGPGVIFPGADDNSSGTAGLLLLAQSMLRRDQEQRAGSRRTVVFIAFAGEERGLMGSSHFVGHLEDLGATSGRIIAMINMDMIGRMTNNRLYVFGPGPSDGWKRLVRDANRETKLRLNFQGVPVGASDHVNFVAKGIPSLHFFTGAHDDYHRPTDTSSKINSVGAARVLHLIDALLAELTVRSQRIAFVEEKTNARPIVVVHGEVAGPRLGIVPDYATLYGDEGCSILSAIPGGPAAEAGIQDGDVIVRWNDDRIDNVHDMIDVLRGSTPGETIHLTIRHGTRSTDLSVILGAGKSGAGSSRAQW